MGGCALGTWFIGELGRWRQAWASAAEPRGRRVAGAGRGGDGCLGRRREGAAVGQAELSEPADRVSGRKREASEWRRRRGPQGHYGQIMKGKTQNGEENVEKAL